MSQIQFSFRKNRIKIHVFFFQTASSSGDPHVHIIKMVKPEDEGLYTCIAGNFLGQAEASAYLEVNGGPAGPRIPASPLTLAAAALLASLFTQHLLSWLGPAAAAGSAATSGHRWHHQQSF